MARRSADALAKQKEARQKKMLIALAPILLILLAWQGPGTLKALTGGADAETAPPPPAPTMATGTTPDPTTGAAPSTATGTPPVAPAGTAAGTSGATLPDTTDPVAASAGQLVTFDRFVGKDPFRQQVAAETTEGEGGDGTPPKDGDDPTPRPGTGENPFTPPTSGGGGGGGGSGGGGGGGGGGTGGLPTATGALFDVNGAQETVGLNGTFPAEDPILRLLSGTTKSVKVALVSGQFSNGSTTLTLKVGKSVTLVSRPDGIRYVIKLVAVE